jgi:hypothetical protein
MKGLQKGAVLLAVLIVVRTAIQVVWPLVPFVTDNSLLRIIAEWPFFMAAGYMLELIGLPHAPVGAAIVLESLTVVVVIVLLRRVVLWRGRRGNEIGRSNVCGKCGYDLVGLSETSTCPECGERRVQAPPQRHSELGD